MPSGSAPFSRGRGARSQAIRAGISAPAGRARAIRPNAGGAVTPPEQQERDRFLVETRGAAGGPSKIWLQNPKLVKAAAPLGAYFHPGGYSLSEREREIAVTIINSKWQSAYPTNAHERRGKEVGLPAEKVEAMLSGLPTSFADEREQVVYEMAICLNKSRSVSKGLYDRAVKALGHVGITDVITLMGYYTSVSRTG
jgi:4-carboxymuconolactone decarboxylase